MPEAALKNSQVEVKIGKEADEAGGGEEE